jgi:periplasmic protein TonB
MANGAVPLYRVYELPWSTALEDDAQFKKLARGALVAALVIALVLYVLPEPQIDPTAAEQVPKRLVRLVLERETPPPPPPAPIVREEPTPQPEPERVVEERVVEPEPTPVPVPRPVAEPPPVDRTQQARDRARVAGLLPLASQLQSLRTNVTQLDRAETVAAAASDRPFAERALVTSRVGTASGGINTAALSRNTGGNGLSGRETTVVDNPVEGFAEAGGAAQRSGTSDLASRSREEIERVFDANKGRIFTLYNRALRANPALQGKVVLRLTISADGRVTFCEIVSSELNDAELERGLVQRVLQFQFEARDDVESITTTKPIDFFPA